VADASAINSGGGRTTGANPAPFCQAILLCDDVKRDERTNKTSIIGIFDTFCVPTLPSLTPPCKLFLLLVDAVGKYTLTAEVRDPAQGVVLFRSPGSGEFARSAQTSIGEISLPIESLPFDRPGTYELVVFANQVKIGRVRFNVRTSGG